MTEKMEEIKKLNKDARQEQIDKETYKDCLVHLEDKEIPIRGEIGFDSGIPRVLIMY